MEKYYIYIDLDDTVIDADGILSRQYEDLYGVEPPYDYYYRSLDEGFMELIESAEFMGVDRFNENIVKFVFELYEYSLIYPEYEVKFLTHRGYHPEAISRTKKVLGILRKMTEINLEVEFLNPLLEEETDKLELLRNRHKGEIWILIDDNPSYNRKPHGKYSDNLILVENEVYGDDMYDHHVGMFVVNKYLVTTDSLWEKVDILIMNQKRNLKKL